MCFATPVVRLPNHTMKTKSIVTLISASAFAFALTSCDSKRENAREDALEQKADSMENTADHVRKNAEAKADMKEEQADAIRKTGKSNVENAADAVENEADRVRDAAEKSANRIEDKADAVREQK